MSGRITDLFKDKHRMHKKHATKARRRINRWVRDVGEGYAYQTIKGRQNVIEGCDNKYLYFSTNKSKVPNKVSKEGIKLAGTYLFYMGTINRKDIERVARFTSAVFGILNEIFGKSEASLSVTKTGKHILTAKGCYFFFSGMDRASNSDWEMLKSHDVDSVLMNYHYLKDANTDNWKKHVEDYPMKVMVDCGEFQRFQKAEKIRNTYQRGLITVEERDWMLYEIKSSVHKYAEFINQNKSYIHSFVTMDVTESPEETIRNYKTLERLTGMSPIPAWHVNPSHWESSDWDGLQTLVDEGHKVIAIGATVGMRREQKKRPFLKALFDKFPNQNFHILGYSSYGLVDLPIFSADSGGWTSGRKKSKNGGYQVYTLESEYQSTRKVKPVDMAKETIEKFKRDCVSINIKRLSSLLGGEGQLEFALL